MRIVLMLTLLLLWGCDSNSNGKTAKQIEAEVLASQKAFKENQLRIEAENRAREALLKEQRSYIKVNFVSVDEEYLRVELINISGQDIDNIVGSLEVIDESQHTVTSIALTNWIPGDIYLPSGGKVPASKSLSLETPERRQQLLDRGNLYQLRYTVLRIQFAGQEEINYLQPVLDNPVVQPVKKKPTPENQVSAQACTSEQLTIETDTIYYPGPKCEHISRNMDSERFKLEYINMCKSALDITGRLDAVARVQISSCVYETERPGLTYKKRICCDKP